LTIYAPACSGLKTPPRDRMGAQTYRVRLDILESPKKLFGKNICAERGRREKEWGRGIGHTRIETWTAGLKATPEKRTRPAKGTRSHWFVG
jgi:hypothetical protein